MLPLRSSWRWWVCGLLLLATMVNYMDRLTLNLLARHINADLDLSKQQYASIESGFALAFASGALVFGFLADRINIYWLYPLAVLAWSGAGFLSGFATSFAFLLVCRVALGLAESANWPCALRTTQRILPPAERGMGNSILQSGAALGAIALPFALQWLFDEANPQTWRWPFMVVGVMGAGWTLLWWGFMRPADLAPRPEAEARGLARAIPPALATRRYVVLVVLVVTINMTWHFLRAWGPLFLQEKHFYTQDQTNRFSMAYYVCTDLGALVAGAVSLWLVRRGAGVHRSRLMVFLPCALLCLLSVALPFLSGWPLVAAFLLVGFGSLGLFPCYYSFSQDLSEKHQGKITGTLGCVCWVAMAAWQSAIGWTVQSTGSYEAVFVASGFAPLVGFLVLALFWNGPQERLQAATDGRGNASETETRLQA